MEGMRDGEAPARRTLCHELLVQRHRPPVEEILGLHLMIEFRAISVEIEAIRVDPSLSGPQLIITEATEFDFITTETDDFQLETE